MDKNDIRRLLRQKEIPFDMFDHAAVYTIEEAAALNLPEPEAGAKNLFLRDDKKRNYYLLTVRDDRPVDLKAFQQLIGSRRLSFASEEDLMQLMGLIRGSVTPFGLLNDTENRVRFYLDDWYIGRRISVHPNENTATLFLPADAMMEIIRQSGTHGEYISLS